MSSYYVWDKQSKSWNERKQCVVIGRLVSVSPLDNERYYLRLLLNHVKGPTSFSNIRFVNGIQCSSYRDAAMLYGLLDTDDDIEKCLAEACLFEMPYTLRRLFATLLVYCNPNNPRTLWNRFENALSEDYNNSVYTDNYKKSKVLQHISFVLQSMGKHLVDYDFVNFNFSYLGRKW